MKKSLLLLSIIATLSCVCEVFAQKPVYIYRNEGYISSFITEEIDSITYSRMDADSIMQSEYCMTDIHTCDSIYRIPIASIDSISFITPPTILKPDVFNIDDELLKWVTGREKLTFYLNPSTPSNLLPETGKVVVSLASADTFIKGIFFGKVSDIKTESDRIAIVCDPTSFEEAFVRFYGSLNEMQGNNTAPQSRAGSGYWQTWDPEILNINLLDQLSYTLPIPVGSIAYEPIENYAISFDMPEISFSIKPTIKYHASVIFDPPYQTSVSLSIIGDYYLQENIGLSGNFEFNKDITLFKPFLPYGLTDFFFEIGVYGKASVGLSIDKQWNQHYRSEFHWDWTKGQPSSLRPVNKFYCVNSQDNGDFAINGNLGIGLYAKAGVEFIATKDLDIAEIYLRGEYGTGVEGTYLPFKPDVKGAKTDTKFYNKIKNEKLSNFREASLKAEAKLFKWSIATPPDLGGFSYKRWIISELDAVPSFSNINLTRNNDNSIFVKADAKGYVGGNDLGFALSKDGKFAEEDYVYKWNNYKGPDASFNHVYSGKSPDGDYQVYPLIKWMGIEMIADVNGCNNDLHPHNVDLGLPSGTKWCCVNVGASNPTDFGEYYEGSTDKDIATEIMGAGYMTPTKKQFQELLDNTEQIRSTINGVDGFIFKAKNGNSIFLPAAAQLWMDDETSSWEINNKGTGAYWTKTRSDGNYIYFIEFNDEESKPFFGDRHQKNNRLTIRPIYVEP